MDIQTQVALAPFSTLQVGGPAEFFAIAHSVADVEEACAFAHERSLPITIIAGGSNVLCADEGVAGMVIKNEITGVTIEEIDDVVLLSAGAGEVFDTVVADTVARGWWGLENLSHIPGSVGATPVQNVGAYGVEVADVIAGVEVFDIATQTLAWLSPADCQFAYRSSVFKTPAGHRFIITRVQYRLSKTPAPRLSYADLASLADTDVSLATIREQIIAVRAGKFPDWTQVGTAGSFFKNPTVDAVTYTALVNTYPNLPGYKNNDGTIKIPLGYVIDVLCQLRGVRKGNVGTYEGQALVLVNYGGATANEITAFAQEIAQCVQEKIGVSVEWEVTYVS